MSWKVFNCSYTVNLQLYISQWKIVCFTKACVKVVKISNIIKCYPDVSTLGRKLRGCTSIRGLSQCFDFSIFTNPLSTWFPTNSVRRTTIIHSRNRWRPRADTHREKSIPLCDSNEFYNVNKLPVRPWTLRFCWMRGVFIGKNSLSQGYVHAPFPPQRTAYLVV